MNQQQVNQMMAMNAAGGPVGGNPMMNNGAGPQMGGFENSLKLLNTYIYDYFLKNGHYNLARQIWQELPINSTPPTKPSPGRQNVNGVDDSMDTDSKDELKKRPDDLPVPAIPGDPTDNAFLSDWWCQFWDIYSAHRGKKSAGPAFQYVQHTRQQAQMRNEQQNRMLSGNMPTMYGMMRPGMQNGMGNVNEMQKRAMMNNRPTPQQIQAMQNNAANKMIQQNMARDGSNMDMSGQRPPTPGSAENAPSPSKRPRLEGGAGFNGQAMGPGGRSQPMQGPQGVATSGPGNEMMLANGMNPGQMPPNQFGGFNQHQNMQKQQLEVYSQNLALQQRAAISNQMGKAMNPGAPQNSPMVPQTMDNSSEMFPGNAGPRLGAPPGQPGAQQGGNHALQDYQMQLMLLEQQNKKRLLMARQEQDNMSQAPHGPGGVGQPGFAPAMSPSASRPGPSPNPADQMKRGTPKLGPNVLPGSPMPDGSMPQNRASPIPGGFDPSQMGAPGMPPQAYYAQMGPNGMRPPSSHPGQNPNFPNQPLSQAQMEQMRRSGQVPNGMWQQTPQMMQQNPNQPPQQMGTPQQRNATMPPPPAPQAGGNEQQRTQPPSPNQNQQPAAPPTPSQSNKANPKGKKERADTKKKQPKKGSAATGATPASEAEPPTPATPNTPMHPNSFNKPQNGTQQPANGPQQQAPPPAPVAAQPPMDPNAGAPFGNIDANDPSNFDINFAPIDGPDVLENFDFDSFLHTDDNPLPFDATFNFGEVDTGMEAGQ